MPEGSGGFIDRVRKRLSRQSVFPTPSQTPLEVSSAQSTKEQIDPEQNPFEYIAQVEKGIYEEGLNKLRADSRSQRPNASDEEIERDVAERADAARTFGKADGKDFSISIVDESAMPDAFGPGLDLPERRVVSVFSRYPGSQGQTEYARICELRVTPNNYSLPTEILSDEPIQEDSLKDHMRVALQRQGMQGRTQSVTVSDPKNFVLGPHAHEAAIGKMQQVSPELFDPAKTWDLQANNRAIGRFVSSQVS